MTDKELLELAAKAAGIEDANWLGDGSYWVGAYDGGCEWNPLTDDGDALRLAVKIKWLPLMVEFERLAFASDPYSATRRAIVRAAAAIGEMK